MPAQAVAHGAEAEVPAQPVVLQDVLVVACCPNEIEANAVASPMRRAFEAGLQKAGEGSA
jgi:hypothetical protein